MVIVVVVVNGIFVLVNFTITPTVIVNVVVVSVVVLVSLVVTEWFLYLSFVATTVLVAVLQFLIIDYWPKISALPLIFGRQLKNVADIAAS